MGGANKQGGWKIPEDEVSGVGVGIIGGSEVRANCATTSTNAKGPDEHHCIQTHLGILPHTYISITIWVTQQKFQLLASFS